MTTHTIEEAESLSDKIGYLIIIYIQNPNSWVIQVHWFARIFEEVLYYFYHKDVWKWLLDRP